jgi:hypothetical protein
LQVTGKSDGLINIPLNTPQAQAYTSFQSDFTNGGWNAFLNPANNPIGSFFNAVDTLTGNVATQQQSAQNEIQRNNGFLDLKHCTAYANNGQVSQVTTTNQCAVIGDDTTYETCCTGQASDDSAACNNYATADATAAGSPECASIPDDATYNKCCNTNAGDSPMCVAYNTSSAADANSPTALSKIITNISTKAGAGFVAQPVCTQWSTDTPGSIIASQVQSVTNTPVQQLVYANKINQVLGSFFDSFVNNLLSKGLRGSGSSSSSQTTFNLNSGGDNTVVDTTGGANDTSALGYQASGSGDADVGDFDITRPQQLRAVLQTQEDFLNRTEDAQIALERVVPSIGALDYCIPGPNPEWQTGLDSNWQTFESSIQQAPANSPSTLQNIINSIPVVGGLFSAFFGNSSKPPPIWTGNSVLADKATGQNIAIDRTFYTPSGHADEVETSDLENTLNQAYTADVQLYSRDYTVPQNTFKGSPVGTAFEAAATGASDPTYVDGFLQDAYTNTDSLTSYNQAASTVDQQYNQNISDTQNTIEQMKDILHQVNTIVSTAKARYIANNPTVNLQCLNQAYVINTTDPTPVARTEPNTANQYEAEEDAMVQHSIQSANYFYSTQAK